MRRVDFSMYLPCRPAHLRTQRETLTGCSLSLILQRMRKCMAWAFNTLRPTSRAKMSTWLPARVELEEVSSLSQRCTMIKTSTRVEVQWPHTAQLTHLPLLNDVDLFGQTTLRSVTSILKSVHTLSLHWCGTPTRCTPRLSLATQWRMSSMESLPLLEEWSLFQSGPRKEPLSGFKVDRKKFRLITNSWRTTECQWQVFGCKTGLAPSSSQKEWDYFGTGSWTATTIPSGTAWLMSGRRKVCVH